MSNAPPDRWIIHGRLPQLLARRPAGNRRSATARDASAAAGDPTTSCEAHPPFASILALSAGDNAAESDES